jgi:hypothetical protein
MWDFEDEVFPEPGELVDRCFDLTVPPWARD